MRIRDAALPAGLAAVVAAVALTGADSDDRMLLPWGWTLILVSSAALLWRRRFPIAVLGVTGAACLAYYPLGFPDTPIALSLVVALYTVSRERGSLPSGSAAGGLLLIVTVTASEPLPTAAAVAPLLTLPVVLGEVIRGRARQTAQAEERAALAEAARTSAETARRNADEARTSAETARRNAEDARRSAEASREAEALRRATEERLRISRELHDALGHQLSLISVQAGAALHTRSPEAAFTALRAIRTASGDALHDLRDVLGVLREPVRPGLAALPDLFDRTSATGLTVRPAVHVPDPMPSPAVQQAVYRIIQEALTNAVRHATAATTVDVAVHLAPPAGDTAADQNRTGEVPADRNRSGDGTAGRDRPAAPSPGRRMVVVVENDGAEVTAGTGGGGLHGMTERAAALGGTLTAGPRPGGGFRVEARLPLDENGAR
jgi:signal transduction histidine kinase